MQLLIDYAKSEGLKTLTGQVLHENTMMLAMCRELGFSIASDPQDPCVAAVSLDLAARRQAREATAPFLRAMA